MDKTLVLPPAGQAVELTLLSTALSAAIDIDSADKAVPISSKFDYNKFVSICASLVKFLVENLASWDESASLARVADELLHVGQAFVYLIGKSIEFSEKIQNIGDAWLGT